MSETSPTESRRLLEGQRLQPERYSVIPRTLTFLTREGQVLLLRVAEGRGAWSGRFNGLGGHIEQGEDAQSAARREVAEESGLHVDSLDLAGIVLVDTATRPGIALFVFSAEVTGKTGQRTREGELAWLDLEHLGDVPLVDDLPILLPRVLRARQSGRPFFGCYRFDQEGRVQMQFPD
jgi:8-oxo-dGTP diphosphatase